MRGVAGSGINLWQIYAGVFFAMYTDFSKIFEKKKHKKKILPSAILGMPFPSQEEHLLATSPNTLHLHQGSDQGH